MTIEERLDKLTERHEALARSIELLVASQRDNERLMQERAIDYEQRFAQNQQRLAQLMETMTHIKNIVEAHEQRLDDFEENQ